MKAPHFLPQVEAEIDGLQRGWPEATPLRAARYSHFCFVPSRFAPAFPRVGEPDLVSLTVFCQLFVSAVLLRDQLLDGVCPSAEVGPTSMRILALETEATRVLQRLIPPGARFWGRYRDYLSDYARAFVYEDDFRRGRRALAEYDEAVAVRAAADKIGLARIAVAALAELEGDDALLGPICASLEQVGVAMGMHDDVTDWKEDLRGRQPSLVLSRVLCAFPGDLDDTAWAGLLRELGRAIHYGGHSAYVLRLALSSLDAPDRLQERLPGLPWYEFARQLRHACQASLETLAEGVRENVGRARRTAVLAAAGPGASGLVRPWRLAVEEAPRG
jgi:hypothetical protein